ncbi:MAG: DUF1707 SHOCT-like domain-containing protein, partial [Acidimicrobiales bacterium]
MSSTGGDLYPLSDGERDAAVTSLVKATGDGRLTLEEFGQRAELALTTDSRIDLEKVTGDLPEASPSKAKRHWFAPFGNRIVEGRFALSPNTKTTMLVSEIHLDLRGAFLVGPESTIKVKALAGTLRVLVPTGVRVEVDQSSLFGGRSRTSYGPESKVVRPLLRIRMIDVMGGVKVTDDPAKWSPYMT